MMKFVSFRIKIVIALVAVVVVGGIVSLTLGIKIFDDMVKEQMKNRVATYMDFAWMIYHENLMDIQRIIEINANRVLLKEGLRLERIKSIDKELEGIRKLRKLDVLNLTDGKGRVLVRAGNPEVVGDDLSSDELIRRALKKRIVASTQIVSREVLEREGIAGRIGKHTVSVTTSRNIPGQEGTGSSGMMLEVAAPVLDENGNLLGILSGGRLLNGNWEMVDEIENSVYKREKYKGKEVGDVIIFQRDLAISTTLKHPGGIHRVGMIASKEVADAVLGNGKTFMSQASMKNDSYVTINKPIKNIEGKVIGILCMAILEQPVWDMRNNIIWSFIRVCFFGVLVVLILGYLLARSITKPVSKLVQATKELSRGNLDYRLDIKSKDELNVLGNSFNNMAGDIKKTMEEKDSINKRLAESEKKYRNLFDRVQQGIFITSKDGKFVDCNQAMLDLLGYRNKEELFHIDITRDLYLNPEDRDIFQKQMEERGFVKDYEVNFRRKNGEKVTVLVTSNALEDEKGEIVGYEGLNVDITERKKIETKLGELNDRYVELLGFATHELKQPLSAIKGYLIMLRDETIGTLATKNQRQAVGAMLRNVDRLIDMSQKYLRLSKIENGEIEVIKKRFNVFQEIIKPMMRREKIDLEEKGMNLIIEDRSYVEGLEIEADALLIDIVLSNLVNNAIKYGRKGGNIFLSFKEEKGRIIFNVKNEGEGIPQGKLKTIFEKFVRLEKASSPLKGTGLGLYNTREIVQMHGGEIWAESEMGKYASFIFTLPNKN